MGTVSVPSLTGTDPFTVNGATFDGKVDPLVTEFNGSIENVNISASAAIANSKLNLAAITQAIAHSGTMAHSGIVTITGKPVYLAKGSDVASATTMTLGLDGNQYDMTGTTTIQTINHTGAIILQAGTVIWLKFDGALTLTDDTGNLELQGSDLVVAAEDVICLLSDGTNWHLASHSTRLGASQGKLEFVTTTAASAVSEIEFAALAAGYDYIFVLQNIIPADDDKELYLRTAASTGVFDNGPNEYSDGAGTANQNQIKLTPGLGSATGEGGSGIVTIANPASSLMTQVYVSNGVAINLNGGVTTNSAGGVRISAAAVVDVQFLWESGGNFAASGNFFVYRRKLS